MLDVAWPELMVVGAVALVAIGPKDLPRVMRTLGRWAGKLRDAAYELRNCYEQLSAEADAIDRKNENKNRLDHEQRK